MKAAHLPENEVIIVIDKEEPKTSPEEAIVSVAYTGICGSDMHVFFGHGPRVKPPTEFTLGHEASGIIEYAPANSSFKQGDRVAINPLIGCGT